MAVDPKKADLFRPNLTRRVRQKLLSIRHNPTPVIAFTLIVGLAYVVLGPIIAMLSEAFQVQFQDRAIAEGEPGSWTTYYFHRVFTSEISQITFWRPLGRTVVVALGSSTLALLFGLVLAWLVTSTDLLGRRWLGPALILPYMLPSWAFAVAWITIFKNRRLGGAPGFAESAGFSPPDWLAYGMIPMTIALALHYFPFAFLLYANGFKRIDTQLEESAQVLGASRWTIMRKIALPILLPTTMSAILLTFSRTVGTFGTPYVLGSPVGETLLSTSLYSSFRSGSPGTAAMIAIVMVLMGVAIVAMDVWLIRQWRRFVTVGGKGGSRRRMPLRRWRLPATAFAWAILLAAAIVPFAVIFLSTIMRIPGVFTIENFTSQFWTSPGMDIAGGEAGVLRNDDILRAAFNSLRIAGIAAVVTGVLGVIVGYVVVRMQGSKTSFYLRQVSFLPYLVPGIAFAAAALSLFAVSRGPVPSLYGTLALLVIVMVVMYLPYAARSSIASMMQSGNEPEEAAMVLGARFRKRIAKIILPMQRGPMMVGVLLPFISGMKELSLVVMLVTPGTHLLTTQALKYTDLGYIQLSNASILLIGVITAVAAWLIQRITGTSLAEGFQK